jgi:putative glutamine amidotransferase
VIELVEAYVQAVAGGGALPVLIPLGLARPQLAALVARLDGLVFSGGGDIAPARYGGVPHPLVAGVDPDRDQVELDLFAEAMARRRPLLGICRGMQLMNVALGGTLYEDVLAQHPGGIKHQYWPDMPRDRLSHEVTIAPQSRLAAILGSTRAAVNSLHHQGVRRLADGLVATAHAPDGLIEAFELPEHPFALAVQWHPEWLPPAAAMAPLFAALTAAA